MSGDNGHTPAPRIEEEVDLFQIIKLLRRHWLLFCAVWILVSLCVVVVAVNLRPKFRAHGTFYLEDKSTDTKYDSLASLLPFAGNNPDVESQKKIIQSGNLAVRIISQVGFNGGLDGPKDYLPSRMRFWQWYLDPNPKRYAQGLRVAECDTHDDVYVPVHYEIRFEDDSRFAVREDGQPIASGQLGQVVHTPQASFKILYNGDTPLQKGLNFELTVKPSRAALESFVKGLSVAGGGRGSQENNLISVAFVADSPYTAMAVVEKLIQEYIDLTHLWATSVSRATLSFVTSQLDEIRSDMDKASHRLSEYQKQSGLLNLDSQLEAELGSLVGFEVELREQQIKLFQLNQLAESLKVGKPNFSLLASVEDPLAQKMAEKLAEMNSEIAALSSQFQANYPPLVQLLQARDELINDLSEALKRYAQRAHENERQLAETVDKYQQRMAQLPERGRVLAEYLRSTKLFEDLYLFLLREKHQAKIAEASTLSNIRVVDHPRLPLKSSRPKPMITIAMASALGLLAAAASIVVLAFRVNWYTSIDEVKAEHPYPVFAIVPHRDKTVKRASAEVIEHASHSPYLEAVRLLRVNLLHTMAGRNQQSVLITSSLPGDGENVDHLQPRVQHGPGPARQAGGADRRGHAPPVAAQHLRDPAVPGAVDLPQRRSDDR